MAIKKFNVQCTQWDKYYITYDSGKYPELQKLIDDDFGGDPWEAEKQLDISVELDSGGYEPDTDVSTLEWEKPYE